MKGLKFVLYGPEGIGKSTFVSHIPGVVYIDTEGSTARMDVARGICKSRKLQSGQNEEGHLALGSFELHMKTPPFLPRITRNLGVHFFLGLDYNE